MAFQRKKPRRSASRRCILSSSNELATSVDRVPCGARWIHEIKFDGYRVQVHLRDAAVKVFTRRGNDWTNRFRKIASANGTTDFSVLQNELKGRSARS